MAIEIRFNLNALPNPLSLPGAVTLTQTLRSNQPSEGVDIEYRLEDDHNVYFEDTAGGHSYDADPLANARRWARHYVYLAQQLMD